MKTGRLLKFHRPGGDVHAYVYQEPDGVHAVLYRFAVRDGGDRRPLHEIHGRSSEEVEAELRAWVDTHYPRAPR